ncbi:META domain-containing protein [Streptomyces sp. TRM64462]|uniref:META domain-containing protein n=1 Tax=Streptomyces sp. TRM64462 TaxID=2741726 RepID=UPI0015867100|nr:META domain-containing protein [Streptomyces sp. TRM64462]
MPNTKKQPLTAAAALAALLVLTGCGGSGAGDMGAGTGTGPGSDPAAVPVTGVHWTVDSLTVDGERTAAPAPTAAYVEFTGNNQAKGNFGCNHFTAAATVEGETVTVGTVSMTEMACDEPVQSFEDTFRKTFTGELRARLADERLTLTNAAGDRITLREEAEAPLTGTTWTVDSLIAMDAASSLPEGTAGTAHLTIAADGSVRGNLGCNSFTSTVTDKDGTLTFGRIATTRRLCTGPAGELEQRLLRTLRGGTVTYRIDHRTLTLTAPDGTGFAARAGRPDTAPSTTAPFTTAPPATPPSDTAR